MKENPKIRQVPAALRNTLLFLLLIGLTIASFSISFFLGKNVLSPVRKIPESKIKMEIPKPPASIAGLQDIKDIDKKLKENKIAKEQAIHPHSTRFVERKNTKGQARHFKRRCGLFKVQVGYYSSRDEAAEKEKEIQDNGFETCLVKQGNGWTVQAGAFRSRERANALQQSLSQKGFGSKMLSR